VTSNLLATKLRRDLRAVWPRIALMVAAVAVSLTVFSGVLYTYGITSREVPRAYLSTHPASATILLQQGIPASEARRLAGEVRTRPGITDATARSQFTTQIRDSDGGWRSNPLQIFAAAPDDPMRIASFQVEQGVWPPAPGEILIERKATTLLGLKLGDSIVIKSPDGTPTQLRVSGIVHDPSLAPAPQEQKGYGFMAAPSTFEEIKLSVDSSDRHRIAAIGREVGDWLQREKGIAVREVQVPQPLAHPHQGQIDAILLAMLVFGAAAVLLSAILVATMLNGLFTQQIPQIGIMKAIGAATGRIARLYLAMTLLIATAATALALAPGILISRLWASAILNGLLGMDAASLAAPLWMYATVIALGAALPPLLALAPLVRASRTTVRAAIDHRGVSGTSRVEAWLRGLNRSLLLALRNSTRRRARFALSAGLLAAAGTLFVAGMSTLAGAQRIPANAQAQRHWDVEAQLVRPIATDEALRAVHGLPHVKTVEAWSVEATSVAEPGRLAVTRTYPDQGHGSVGITAIPVGTELLTSPKLLEGRWLRPGETGAVVLNQIARANTVPGAHAGDTVQLLIGGKPVPLKVVGIASEIFVSTGIYLTTEGYAEATGRPGHANALRIVTDAHDPATRLSVADAVDAALGTRSVTTVDRMEEASTGHMLPIIAILLAIAVAMGVVGMIGLASTMSANVLERTREFGVMHAIGARAATVRRIVEAEAIFTALASCLLAAIPALVLTRIMGAGLGNMFMYTPLPFRVSPLAVVIWIVLIMVGAVLASSAPARRASRLTVREALAYL
jgi:putative ABC transport system permease protein